MPTSSPPKLLRDGIISLLAGMNSGIDPVLLPVSQCAYGQNIMVRGGFAQTRFGLKERGLTFENTEHQGIYEDDLFQGAGYFAPTEKTPMLIASVGGRIWKIDVLNDFAVTDITPVGGTTVAGVVTDVTWTNVVGATDVSNTLTKTAVNGWANSGAFSNQSIASGNGYIEFIPAQTDKDLFIGFGDAVDAGQDFPEILWAIYLQPAGALVIIANGVAVSSLPANSYSTTDVMRIEISGGKVHYKKNGTIIYTSSLTPVYPLFIDTAMFQNGAIISGVKLVVPASGSISPPIGGSLTIGVADTTNIHVGYPVIIGSGYYTVTAKTLTTITATNLDATSGVNIAFDTPVYFLSPNMSLLPKTWMLQAETYFIIQNGMDGAIIYDGATARRAVRNGLKLEVPTGTAMAYWQGRIWVAVNKHEVEAGDIFGGPTTIIDFTEALYLNEGGPFRVPTHAGEITALVVLPVLDQSLGQGALQVHTKTTISTINVPPTRAMWKDITDPVQTIALMGFGATSDKSTLPVNMDLFFRGTDGLRSFRMARQEQGGTWANTPISKEMVRILRNDDAKFLQYSSATLFENLLLFTVNPLPFNSGRATYWRGLGVLDFDPISAMGQKSPPVYAGLWSGVNIMQIVTGTFQGKDRCFLFVRNAENKNELWELDPTNRFDGDDGKIRCRIESRAMGFGSETLKNLQSALLRIDNLEGEAQFRLYFRPDANPCWTQWGQEKTRCAQVRQCSSDIPAGTCFTPTAKRPGYRTKIGFGQPPDGGCDEFDKKPVRISYTTEVALEWDGAVRIKMLRLKAYEAPEKEHPDCDED